MNKTRGFLTAIPIIVILLAASPAFAANPTHESFTTFHYWEGFGTDTGKMLRAPGHWDRRDWEGAALVVGLTAMLYPYDSHIQKWAQKNRDSTTNSISDFARPFGDGRYTLPALGALYLLGSSNKNDRQKETALRGVESFVITGVFTQGLKLTGHRHRPSEGDGPHAWDGPGGGGGHMSFPSGHASSAFAVATVFAEEYRHSGWVPPVAYGLASLTALSRVNDNAHWASDIFFGSALGWLTGRSVVHFHEKKSGDASLAFAPADLSAPGFQFTFQF